MIALAKQKPIITQELLKTAVLMLQKAQIESASLDARLLLEHVLRVSREQLLLRMEEPVRVGQEQEYLELIARRTNRQPVAQLIERREFWGIEFCVSEATLDPRPDSETLIESVLFYYRGREKPVRILDLGTGTGCLLLSLLSEFPQATGLGIDASDAALIVAKENSLKLGYQARAAFKLGNWHDGINDTFDIIVANPPYIPTDSIDKLAPEVARWEPRLALDGGEDGLNCYRIILSRLPQILAENGVAALEIGLNQQQPIEALIKESGLEVAGVKADMGGIARCIVIKHKQHHIEDTQ
jgi:release factor glutamine methyltransferase